MIEEKLHKSLLAISIEIDELKDPLKDVIQNIGKDREMYSLELERTQYANRQLVLQSC